MKIEQMTNNQEEMSKTPLVFSREGLLQLAPVVSCSMDCIRKTYRRSAVDVRISVVLFSDK